eukprot:1114751-Pyramimonas_sp.AAC.1
MKVQQLRWFAVLKSQKWHSGVIQGRPDAAVRLMPKAMFWHASRSSKRCLFQRGCSPSENETLYWPMNREHGGMVYPNIVDDSW